MNREALAQRNRQLAEAFHSTPMRHYVRRALLHGLASVPFDPLYTRARRVLFIKPDHIGDLLLATPAFRALKAVQPNTEIHVLAGAWASDILENVPEVDQVLTLAFPGFDRRQTRKHPLAPYWELVRASRLLRHIGYSAAVVMRPDHWWGAALTHMAGIRERIGCDLPDVQRFLTRRVPYRREHVVRQNLRLIEHWTGFLDTRDIVYRLDPKPSDRQHLNALLKERGVAPDAPLIIIHAGAGTWVKRWENKSWAQVASALSEETRAHIVFTGSASERGSVFAIQQHIPQATHNLAGDLTLGQLTALCARARCVLGVDSGPLHIAAAVGTPTVALFGAADPVEFAQWGDRKKHLVLTSTIGCRPCRVLDWGDDAPENHPCMREITLGDVLEAARRVLHTD